MFGGGVALLICRASIVPLVQYSIILLEELHLDFVELTGHEW